jgi:malate synthase
MLLPDRAQITMTVPFMRAYTELLVKTCHKRGAHAIGGMAAFIPSRRDPEVNKVALAKVRDDKDREANDGFDGSWVAHPDLVSVAKEAFDAVLGDRQNQKERQRDDVHTTAKQLISTAVPGGKITAAGFRANVDVGLQYINSWLMGNGAAAIYNLMEDAATAEISRSQLWQWIHNDAALDDGTPCTLDLYQQVRAEEVQRLGGPGVGRLGKAAEILDDLISAHHFVEFLTQPAYLDLP